MYNKIVALLVTFGLVMGAFAMGFAPANANEHNECVPSDAVYQTVVVTPAQDAVYETVTIPEVPAVTEERLVKEAVEGSPGVWANWAPNDTRGPQDYTPIWPSDDRGTWITHNQLPPGHEGPDGVYNKSGGQGNSPWFYRQAAVEAQDAVYETVIVTPAVPERTEQKLVTPAKDAVTKQELVKEAVTCEEPPRGNPNPPVDKPEVPTEKPVKPETPVTVEKPEAPKAEVPTYKDEIGKTVELAPYKAPKNVAATTHLPNTGAGDYVAGIVSGLLLMGAGTMMLLRGRRKVLTD